MIQQMFIEGAKNLVRSIWLSVTAISVITISLSAVAFVSTLSTLVGYAIFQLDDQIAIVAYFKEGTSQETIDQVQSQLKSLPEVESVKFVDQETAKQELLADTQIAQDLVDTLQQNKENLLLEYLEIKPNNSGAYNQLFELLKADPYSQVMDEVIGSQEYIDNLQIIYRWTNIVVILLVVIFSAISILVMINILRITIYNHRDEIEIMRLVGATNNYIRGPFIVEGVYFNLVAALIVIAVFVPVISYTLPNIQDWLNLSIRDSEADLLRQIYTSIGLTIGVGFIVGIITSYLATNRYLKL